MGRLGFGRRVVCERVVVVVVWLKGVVYGGWVVLVFESLILSSMSLVRPIA